MKQRNAYRQSRKGVRGFTLIELLVVISIIALLLAILMPSLSRAREQARRIVCQSHLKEMDLATRLYAQNNDGFFPPHSVWGSPWFDRLEPYLSEKWADNGQIFQCPSDSRKHARVSNDYGMSWYTQLWGPWLKWLRPQKMDNIKIDGNNKSIKVGHVSSATFITLMDAGNVLVYSPAHIPPSDWTMPNKGHKTGANYLMLDGHVEWGTEKYRQVFGENGFPFPRLH